MSIEQLRAAIALISDNPRLADFVGPQPLGRVISAEKALNVRFPPTYREFLLQLGCGGFDSLEFYGVVKDDFENSRCPDAVWMTNRVRTLAATPGSYVLVSETGDGAYYAIDTSQVNSSGESPVVEWWPGFTEAEDNPRSAASDFGDFLLRAVRSSLGC
jgi:SMI1-KNR4 cell-wall